MKKTSKPRRVTSAESIARKADKGENISSYFTNKGKMMPPLEIDGIDLNPEIIERLDAAARKLKITRQALIKQFIRQGLNEQNLSQKQRRAG
jgi:sortase (surface protein transpeptidase)